MTIKAIFFDMDGTIVDTENTAHQVLVKNFKNWNIELDKEDMQSLTGRKWSVMFQALAKKYPFPLSPTEAEQVLMEDYRQTLEKGIVTVKGSVDAVKSLSENYPLALVSGSNRREITFILTQLGILDCFKCILGAEDYVESKPSPESYLKALEMLQVDPKNGLVFEDSKVGIEAGCNAGMWVAAITGTNFALQDQSMSHFQVKDFSGVDCTWVERLSLNF